MRAASERQLQARTCPTLAPQSASSPYGPPPPTANHHPNLDCTPRTDRIRVPCPLAGPMAAAFAVRGRCGRRRAAASGPGAWATTMALRPARAAETRRQPAAAAAAVVAGAMRIRGALYECMCRGRCGATGGRVCRDARAYPIAFCGPPRRGTVHRMRVQSDRACMCVHHNSIHSMARTIVGLNYNASARVNILILYDYPVIRRSRRARAD